MAQSRGPLDGVKVVACSTAQAGTVPYMLMADLGAEVIKIEVPNGGDNTRAASVFPGLPSTIFETNNRGVKSVTLNLKSAEAREILYKQPFLSMAPGRKFSLTTSAVRMSFSTMSRPCGDFKSTAMLFLLRL